MIKTSSKQSSPKTGKKAELTKARVDASMKDLNINLERDKLKDSKKSDKKKSLEKTTAPMNCPECY